MVEVAVPGRSREWGLVFEYSATRQAGMICALLGFVLFGVVLVVVAEETEGQVIGWILVALMLPLIVLGVATNVRRRVVLTTTRVVLAHAGGHVSVPWDRIRSVHDVEWAANHSRTRYVGLVVTDPGAVQGAGALQRRLLRTNHMIGVDVAIVTTCLAVAPEVLFATVDRFHRDPAAREELTEVV